MTNDYHITSLSVSNQFEEVRSTGEIYENQSLNGITYYNSMNVNEAVNNNHINDHKPLPSSYSVPNEVSFNPGEWFITDSHSRKRRQPRQNEFLLLLLQNPKYSSYITWTNTNDGTFRILEPERVAILWRKVKHRHTDGNTDYETFARGLRFYYESGLMIKTHKKHTFRFKLPLISVLKDTFF